MRFSLVVATLGRTAELQRLLESLDRQTHRDFEVIVVDQNPDDRLLPILDAFASKLDIRRLVSSPGVSRARNVGIAEVVGEIVGFPDDDCWYADDVLSKLNTLFAARPEWDALLGEAVDDSGRRIMPWRESPGHLTKPMCWRQAVTFAYFIRAHALCVVGGFDECIGPGAGIPWGSGEDNDLMLRVLEAGFRVQYETGIKINHPRMFLSYDGPSLAKRYDYALGDGRLLRKHPMPLWWSAMFFAVPASRIVFALARLRAQEARFHRVTLSGRIKGIRFA